MKPLALHLVVIFLVGSQLLSTVVLQTTTGQPPSLPSPQRSQITTTMTPSLSSSALTSSIKLMTITSAPNSTAIGGGSSSTSANTNNNSNQRSMAHDHLANDAPDEDSTTQSSSSSANGRSNGATEPARDRSMPKESSQRRPRRLHPQYRSPSAASSPSSSFSSSSSSLSGMQQQVQHRHQYRRQSESSTSQPSIAVAAHQPQTAKTPRMIHRMVGGHIQNSPSTLTTSKPSTPNFIKRTPLHISSSYRSPKIGLTQPIATTTRTTRKPNAEPLDAEDRDDIDDAAYLDDPGDFDNWDNGILRLSAGSGKETSTKGQKKDESKKTLSDQVRDGKYGLIEKELFRRQPDRPGVLSYSPNKEVPIDNERNYGGLNEEDIWLAEDHLLVIKGGSLNEPEAAEPWPPLDDYDAPGRQIKIPPNPKVPPPFPVQLEENGPIQFIGNSKISLVYPIANESISIYSTGTEAQSEHPSEADGANEKNLLNRPGKTGSSEKGQNDPSYFYPKPYPPWLFQNQTYLNPFLGPGPLPLAGIGPFTNGSLEAYNGTDFDEDDPSLYYPPPYSFVYKSNYSNPVPPGPLVPGIVLPPPPDAFARLEKPRTKFPVYIPTTSTEIPFGEILTKISEYTPKNVVPHTAKPTRPPPHLTTSPKLQPASGHYSPSTPSTPPSKDYSTPNSVSFVPTTVRAPSVNTPTLSKSNPIYYEYYEARKEPPTTPSYVPEFIPKPELVPQQRPHHKPSKGHNKSKTNINPQYYYATTTTPRPSPSKQQYVPTTRPQYVYEDYVYITPKPEIHPNGISNTNHNFISYQSASIKVPPLANNLPYESFEREVNAIREKLRFYQSQHHLQDNSIPRTPKSKSNFDYDYNTAKPTSRNFNPPTEYDAEPFKPMVPYSPPVDDANAFRAIAFEKVDNDLASPYYDTTTTVEPPPLAPEGHVRQHKKIRVGAKYLQPFLTPYDREQPVSGRPIEYNALSTPSPKPWVSVERQLVQEVPPPQKSARLQVASNRGYQGQFPGYYYNPPIRQNNRYYDEPFYQQPHPTRKVVNKRPPVQSRPQQLQQQQQQVWNLENDTFVNYAPNRPPLNPEAEFINPYQPFNQYTKPQYSQQQRLPQGQNPYFPIQPPQQAPNRLPNRQQQISLHRDTMVNYRQPLPPLNPDSEYISIPSRNQQLQHPPQQQLPLPSYHSPVQYRDPQQNGNAYYITPKYRRYSGGGGSQDQ